MALPSLLLVAIRSASFGAACLEGASPGRVAPGCLVPGFLPQLSGDPAPGTRRWPSCHVLSFLCFVCVAGIVLSVAACFSVFCTWFALSFGTRVFILLMKFGKILASFFKFFFLSLFSSFLLRALKSVRQVSRPRSLAFPLSLGVPWCCVPVARVLSPPCLSRSRGLGRSSRAQSPAAPGPSAGAPLPVLLAGRCPADLCPRGRLQMWGTASREASGRRASWPLFRSAVLSARTGSACCAPGACLSHLLSLPALSLWVTCRPASARDRACHPGPGADCSVCCPTRPVYAWPDLLSVETL